MSCFNCTTHCLYWHWWPWGGDSVASSYFSACGPHRIQHTWASACGRDCGHGRFRLWGCTWYKWQRMTSKCYCHRLPFSLSLKRINNKREDCISIQWTILYTYVDTMMLKSTSLLRMSWRKYLRSSTEPASITQEKENVWKLKTLLFIQNNIKTKIKDLEHGNSRLNILASTDANSAFWEHV